MNWKALQIPRWLGILLIARLLLSLAFAGFTPVWEYFDEVNHYEAARYRVGIIEENPEDTIPPTYLIFSQVNQPPLYHMMVGTLLSFVDSGEPIDLIGNPQPFCEYPQGNQFFVHDLEEEIPLRSQYRGIWFARFITILVGVGSVWAVWFAAQTLWPHYPDRVKLATTLFTVFSPAVALSSWFNNDAPLMLIGALAIALLARIQRLGMSISRIAAVIVLWGAAVSTKLNGLALFPVIGFIVLDHFRRTQRKKWQQHRIWVLVVIILLIVIIPITNYLYCNEGLCRTHRPLSFTHLQTLSQDFIGRYMLDAIKHLLRTLTTPSPNPAYSAPIWLTTTNLTIFFVGFANAALRAWEERYERRNLALLTLLVLSAFGLSLFRVWWLKIPYMPGRYLALTFPALIMLISTGFHLLSARIHRYIMVIPITIFLFTGIATLNSNYRPLFQYPERSDTLPGNITKIDLIFENGIAVAGYTRNEETLSLFMTTNWPTAEALGIEVAFFNQEGQALSHCEMLAGNALWPTSSWSPGSYTVQTVNYPQTPPQTMRIRIVPLLNETYLDNQPDYPNEYNPMIGNNLIQIQ